MYNYDFKNENIILELVDVISTINDIEVNVNLIITDEKLLLFKNVKANTVLSGRGIYEMPEYELVFEMNLNGINYKIDEENTIIKLREKELIIYNFDLSKVKY